MIRDRDLIAAYKELNSGTPVAADVIVGDPVLSLLLIRQTYAAAGLPDPLKIGDVDLVKQLKLVRETSRGFDPLSLPAKLIRMRKAGNLPPVKAIDGGLV